eukprot:TRINITY_DN47467_c0_g1_i1.p1 TRINITY_DN47467_c0_g1~~TRINITY_DN47467_c0_g1_i1.p1  ORF type:complete len:291 (+),score=117.72 TRINITY_DN47467_c0_g1_i1:126-875(+)
MLLVCVLGCLATAQAAKRGGKRRVPAPGELSKMRVRDLRELLQERGVECEGCVEKEHVIARVRETLHLPVRELDEDPAPDEDEDDDEPPLRAKKKQPKGRQVPKGGAKQQQEPRKRPPTASDDPDIARTPDGATWTKADFLNNMHRAFKGQGEEAPDNSFADKMWADWKAKLESGEVKPPTQSIFGEGIMWWISMGTMPLFVLMKILEGRQKKQQQEAEGAAAQQGNASAVSGSGKQPAKEQKGTKKGR